MNRKSIFFSLAINLMIIAAGSFIFAQTSSRLTGTVTDTTGAVVPNAIVTLTNQGTGTTLTAQTSDSGTYSFDLIAVGTYTVTIEKPGFKRFVSINNNVNVNLPATVNVVLEVGDVSVVVTVESAVAEVQTSTSGNVGTTIEERTVESLPIVGTRGRNPLTLLNFQPGVVVGANTGGGVHVHGSRDRAFNFTLDGIDINESTAGGSNFTPLRPNPDSIQEFQILTSNFTAELGRSSGAQVTLVTKSGTNNLHGNIYEYYQTPDFNANEYENNLLGIPRRQFVQHIFGGSAGGPIVIPGFGEGTPAFHVLRNRAFFFVNLQFLRANETRLAQRTVYTPLARSGIFRYVVGGRNAPAGTPTASVNPDGSPRLPNCSATVTTNCIATYNVNTNSPVSVDPFISSLLGSLPAPNDYSRGDGLNFAGFNFVAPQVEKQYDFVTKLDFKINDNNQFYVRYAKGEQNTFGDIVNGGLQPFPGFPNAVNTFREPENLAVNYRWSPTAKLTNEFIFGYSLFSFRFATEVPDPNVPFILNIPTDPATNFNYNARTGRTYQFVDNLTFDFSPHVIKTGLNFRFGKQFDDRSSAAGQIEPQVFFNASQSSFTGYNLPSSGINSVDLSNLRSTINDLIGRISTVRQGFVVDPRNPGQFAPAGTRWNFTAYYPEYDFYVQDTWRARQNLVLDLGLRYEIKLNPSSKDLPILRPNQRFTVGSAPTNTLSFVEGDLFDNDFNNLSPSVGFAWDPFKTGKTSIRANYRLSYDRFPSFVFGSNIFQSAPGNTFAASANVASQNLLLRNGLPDLTPSLTPNQLRQPPAFSTSGITLVDPDLQFPENHQWFVGVQREIWANNVFEVNYIGRRGVHLFGGYDANQVNIFARDPRFGETFIEAFNTVRAGGNSPLINQLFSADSRRQSSETGSQFVRRQFGVDVERGGVAALAIAAAQRSQGGQTLLSLGGFSPFFFQPYPQFTGAVNVLESNDYSRYNGLEFILRRRIRRGIGYQVAYTYSVSKDTRSFDPTFSTVRRGAAQAASSTPFDINNRSFNYSNSDFDRRHVLNAFYVVELPFGKGRMFASDIPTVLDWVIGGWQLSGTLLWASGRPFTVYSGVNTFSNVLPSTANCNNCPRDLGSLVQRNGTTYFFTEQQEALFSLPAPGELGNTGRNYFIGPGQFQTDASLAKKFRFTERYSFDLRVDVQNLTNTASFGIPVATVTSIPIGIFGQIRDNTTSFARRVQFSGKFNF